MLVLVLATAALSLPLAAIADDHEQDAFVESSLLASAERNPDALVRVIVQGDDGTDTRLGWRTRSPTASTTTRARATP